MRETGVWSPVEALNFSIRQNPLLHLVAKYGIHWLVWSKHEDTLSPEGGECDGGQLPWWSSGYDTCLECERLGSIPPLRHWIFQSVRTHYYSIIGQWPPESWLDIAPTQVQDLFWNRTEQESPPAWTHEAYRPPSSKYSFCCPNQGGGQARVQVQREGGLPQPGPDRGYPIPGRRVPYPWWRGYPGYPPVQMGGRGTPIQIWLGYPIWTWPPHPDLVGYPHLDLSRVFPHLDLAGVPPPVWTWLGYPPPLQWWTVWKHNLPSSFGLYSTAYQWFYLQILSYFWSGLPKFAPGDLSYLSLTRTGHQRSKINYVWRSLVRAWYWIQNVLEWRSHTNLYNRHTPGICPHYSSIQYFLKQCWLREAWNLPVTRLDYVNSSKCAKTRIDNIVIDSKGVQSQVHISQLLRDSEISAVHSVPQEISIAQRIE